MHFGGWRQHAIEVEEDCVEMVPIHNPNGSPPMDPPGAQTGQT